MKPNICSSKLEVQEINVSIPQFYRIRNHFVGCWTANGWITCSRFLGCGDRSVARDKTAPKHQLTQHLGTDVRRETVREITNPNPNKTETEMLSNCRMWTTFPKTHILLKASLSGTSLKTMKLSSK